MFCPAGDSESDNEDFDFGDEQITANPKSSFNTKTIEFSQHEVTSLTAQIPKLCTVVSSEDDRKKSLVILYDLQNAIIKGNVVLIKSILQKSPELCNTLLGTGWSPLTYACYFGNLEVVNVLIDFGANIKLAGQDGCTALMAACKSHNFSTDLEEIIKVLINLKCDISAQDSTGKTALIYAAKHGNIKACVKLLVEILVQDSTKINMKDEKKWTALDWGIFKNNQEIVKLLLDSGANVCSWHDGSKFSADTIQLLSSIMTQETKISLPEDPNTLEDDVKAKGDTEMTVINTETKAAKMESLFDKVEKGSVNTDLVNDNNKTEIYFQKPSAHLCEQTYQKFGQLELFLCGLELSHWIQNFHEHDIRFDQMLHLNMEDLIIIGVTQLGARKRILEAMKDWHCADWKEGSLPDLSQSLNMNNLISIVKTSSDHVLYIGSALRYVRYQIKAHPEVFVPSASVYLEQNSKDSFKQEMNNLLESTHNLCTSIKTLHCHWIQLKQHQLQDKKYTQMDYIAITKPTHRRRKYILLWSVPIVLAVITVCRSRNFWLDTVRSLNY